MQNIIEDLWNGNIVPSRDCGTNDPQIGELIALMERNKEKLLNTLPPNQTIILENYMDCTEEFLCLSSMHAFREGFCLASKLLTDALSNT